MLFPGSPRIGMSIDSKNKRADWVLHVLPRRRLSLARKPDPGLGVTAQFGLNIGLDETIDIFFRFGSQYVDVGNPNGLWLIKDKSPLTVPNWCTFRSYAQVPVVAPTADAVVQSPHQAQEGALVINRGDVNRSDVLRMAFKYMKNAKAGDVIQEHFVDFYTFFGILGGP